MGEMVRSRGDEEGARAERERENVQAEGADGEGRGCVGGRRRRRKRQREIRGIPAPLPPSSSPSCTTSVFFFFFALTREETRRKTREKRERRWRRALVSSSFTPGGSGPASIIQLKSVPSTLAIPEQLSPPNMEIIRFLQKLLFFVVSIISNVINFESGTADLYSSFLNLGFKESFHLADSSEKGDVPDPDFVARKFHWQQKAVVAVMEAGGLNWSALFENPRAQNHFRSIGGLDVLMDGLGPPSVNALVMKDVHQTSEQRFGNLINMQFLCENGRVHKFANSICWPAFMLQELCQQEEHSALMTILLGKTTESIVDSEDQMTNFLQNTDFDLWVSEHWYVYALTLSKVLCSFILTPEDIVFQKHHTSLGLSIPTQVSLSFWELALRWILKVLLIVFPCLKACCNLNEFPSHLRILSSTLQQSILYTFRKLLASSPVLLETFRAEGVWDLLFSENFFYLGLASEEAKENCLFSEQGRKYLGEMLPFDCSGNLTEAHESVALQMGVVSLVEHAATLSINSHNLPECVVLLDALEQSACNADISTILAKSLHRILQISVEQTVVSLVSLDAVTRLPEVACIQLQELWKVKKCMVKPCEEGNSVSFQQVSDSSGSVMLWKQCLEASFELFIAFLSLSDDAKHLALHSSQCIDCLFDLFWEGDLRKPILDHVLGLLKLVASPEEDQAARLQLCSKYLETFSHARERAETQYVDVSIDLLVGIRDMLKINLVYYQSLFRRGECFLHIVSLLNANLEEETGERLIFNVFRTLTCLLTGNDASKVAGSLGRDAPSFKSNRSLLENCASISCFRLSQAAFRALVGVGYQTLQRLLLDFCQWQPSMQLMNALFDMLVDGEFSIAPNILIKSSEDLKHYGLDVFQQLVKDSITNRASCFQAGMLSFLLDWFTVENDDAVILKLAELIQSIGGYSISGKDIRKIFAILHDEKGGCRQQHRFLLLSSIKCMLKEKGPTAFFEFSGSDSAMGQKMQSVFVNLNLTPKRWYFLCITHSIGRAFSGGSMFRCYLDGDLVSAQKCRYAKVSEVLMQCTIGRAIILSTEDGENAFPERDLLPLHGQLGPVYLFGDAISSDQVKSIYSLGPSYMYSFVGNELSTASGVFAQNGVQDAKDSLASKLIFGFNAQATDGTTLFNIAQVPDYSSDKSTYIATLMAGTQLCSRRLLQDIIYCVGGVSVFFPLLTQFDKPSEGEAGYGWSGHVTTKSILKGSLAAEVVELISSVLDKNLENQQQMNLLSGFSVLGFLLQSVSPESKVVLVSALKHLLDVIANSVIGRKPLLDPMTKEIIWERPSREEIQKIRLLLLSLAEMSLREQVLPSDVKALVAFFERTEDNACVEDVLHMVIRALYGKAFLVSFIEQIELLGGCQLFLNLLHRDKEAIRVLALQFIGKLLVGLPSEKKEGRLFNLAVGRSKSLAENQRSGSTKFMPIFSSMLDRLFKFPLTDSLCAALFDVLLGGASPKQVLQKYGQSEKSIFNGYASHFILPQILHLIFTFLTKCNDSLMRLNILNDLVNLLDSNPLNCEALMEDIPFSFLRDILEGVVDRLIILSSEDNIFASQPCRDNSLYLIRLLDEVLVQECDLNLPEEEGTRRKKARREEEEGRRRKKGKREEGEGSEGGRREAEEKGKQGGGRREGRLVFARIPMLTDLGVSDISPKSGDRRTIGGCRLEEHHRHRRKPFVFLQPHLLLPLPPPSFPSSSLLPFFLLPPPPFFLPRSLFPPPATSSSSSSFSAKGFRATHYFHRSMDVPVSSKTIGAQQLGRSNHSDVTEDYWWNVYDKLWVLLSQMNGKGSSKMISKTSLSGGPSFGQRARGLVESLNIPAAEMAAVVVSGGLSNALGGKANKYVDKAMLLRGEKCPRIVFRLVILYLCKSDIERASRCAQQFISLLPCFLTMEDESSKSRLQLFIWSLHLLRSQLHMLDGGARFHVASQLIRESINHGKFMLVNSISGTEDSSDLGGSLKESGAIFNLLQKERVSEEAKYLNQLTAERAKQMEELCIKMEEQSSLLAIQKTAFEDEIQSNLKTLLAAEDNLRASVQVLNDEEQQIVALGSQLPKGIKSFLIKGVHEVTEEGLSDSYDNESKDSTEPKDSNCDGVSHTQHADAEIAKNNSDQKDVKINWKDFFPNSADAEQDEILLSVPCMLVTPKRKVAGHLEVMQHILHFYGELLVEGTGGSSVFRVLCSSCNHGVKIGQREAVNVDPDCGKVCGGTNDDMSSLHKSLLHKLPENIKRHHRWNLCKIKAVHSTRYLLRHTAIEIFFSDSVAPVFFNFQSPKDAKDVGTFIVSFYYGSHYSSMGIVLFYLLRLEPFTMLHRNLQGGKFDHADRLFQSIEGTFSNCLSNTSDVKELIPEFFYMPEFLINSNGYHLGVKQDGEPLADVLLPPWAQGSPEEFIYKNREALESEYVSSNLHHWIDLVFGYKQRGKPAVEAANVFYYLTYEGSVDLDNVEDELQRSAIEDQIANFGQTPIQIFRKKHPRRGPPVPIARPLYYAPASITLTSTVSAIPHHYSAVLFISIVESSVIIVNQELMMSVKMWLTTQLQSGGNFTFSGSQDPFFGLGSDVLTARKIGSPFAGSIELGSQCLATLQTSFENFVITSGNWENSFQIVSLTNGRVVQSIKQHKDVVSCIAVTSDGSVVATGSYDTTVMVWDVRIKASDRRSRQAQTESSRKDQVVSDTPFHILCGHDDIITCLFASVDLDIIISGSKDGTCIFHSLRKGRYIRSIQNPSRSAISKLVVSQNGNLVLYAIDDLTLRLYSVNGKHKASSESIGRLHCLELSRCGEYLACAGDQGHIVLRSMHSLDVIMRYDGIGKAITSLTVTPEECFLAGTKEGNVMVYSVETAQLRRSSINHAPIIISDFYASDELGPTHLLRAQSRSSRAPSTEWPKLVGTAPQGRNKDPNTCREGLKPVAKQEELLPKEAATQHATIEGRQPKEDDPHQDIVILRGSTEQGQTEIKEVVLGLAAAEGCQPKKRSNNLTQKVRRKLPRKGQSREVNMRAANLVQLCPELQDRTTSIHYRWGRETATRRNLRDAA
ncbi:BEACH domain-containing protein B [Nymphaea thermarum]|nr:BEACH domain-containing protein B [Nymphaea thermarum]